MATYDMVLAPVLDPDEPLTLQPTLHSATLLDAYDNSGGGYTPSTVYRMRGMYAPGAVRTRWVLWDATGSPDYAGTGQAEVPPGDLTDIGIVDVFVI